MADWPATDTTRALTFGVPAGSSAGKLVTSGAAHTKGSWAEIIPASSLTFSAYGFLLGVNRMNKIATVLLDIGFGDGTLLGTTVVLPNLMLEFIGSSTRGPGDCLFIPLPIPAATNVWARSQASLTTTQVNIALTPLGQGFLPSPWLGNVEALGVTATTGSVTKGTLITPDTNAKPTTFTTIGTTARPTSMLLLMFGGRGDASLQDTQWFIDIAIGAASSEVVVYQDLMLVVDYNSDHFWKLGMGPLPFSVPATTRISMRAQCSISGSNAPFNVAAYAFS